MLNRFEYIKPTSVDEIIVFLEKYGKEAKILAGGTDLLVQIKKKRISPRYLIDLMGISELGQISEAKGEIRLGSAVTLASLEKSPSIQRRFPSLWKAVQTIGSPQIRNMGTVGGNLCLETRCKYMDFAHPWGREVTDTDKCFKRGGNVCHVVKGGDRCYAVMGGDFATILTVLDSKVVIKGQTERCIPLEDLYTGEGKQVTRLKPNELVTEIRIPFQPHLSGTSYLKLRWRDSLDFPIVNSAACVVKDPARGTCQKIRLALGSLTSAPIRLKKSEDLLRNETLSDRTIEKAVEEGIRGIHIVSNSGIPVGYIRKMARMFVIKAVREAYEASH
jgi:4-hydroxybenzoyl-CoA reductase subunit beta